MEQVVQTCILIQSDQGCYLVDCGMTALVSMSRFDIDPGTIDAVLITTPRSPSALGTFLAMRSAQSRRKSRRAKLIGA